jgi:hypothetical protein
VHAAEQPAEAQGYGDGGVWLRLDRVAERALERSRSLARRVIGSIGQVGCPVTGLTVQILGGIGRFAGNVARLFFGVAEGVREIGIRWTGWGHGCSSITGLKEWIFGPLTREKAQRFIARGLALTRRNLGTIAVPARSLLRPLRSQRRSVMPVLLGFVLGVALTILGVYVFDTSTGRVANGMSATAAGGQAPMVNWDVVSNDWRNFEANVRSSTDNLERKLKEHSG